MSEIETGPLGSGRIEGPPTLIVAIGEMVKLRAALTPFALRL